MKSLEGIESHQDDEEQATDRVSLMKTLRFRNSRNKLEKSEPPYVIFFSKLLGDWPTITKGGCRYLIPARIECIQQLRLLARANIKWHKERIITIPSDEDLHYASFGITGEIIQSQDWSIPINQRRGMSRPRNFQVGMLSFNPSTVKTNTVGKFCTMMGRSQRTALAEWAMVNSAKILDFFNRMNKDTGFRIFYGGLYEGMKLIYCGLFDSDPPINVKLEEHLLGKLDKKLEEERRALDRCEIEIRARKKRVE